MKNVRKWLNITFLVNAFTQKVEKMHKRLLIPGPTEVSAEMLHEQAHFLIGHRTKEFTELYTTIIGKLNEFFQLPDSQKATVTTSSGTLWFDIVGRSIVKEKALACVNGAFSKKFGQAIRDCGKKVEFLDVEWGKAVKPDMLAEKLDSGEYDTLLFATTKRQLECETLFMK